MSSRAKDNIKTTVDMTAVYTARFSIGNATGTLINSTDMKTTVSGSSALGQFLITMGTDNQHSQLLHWEPELQSNAARAGVYFLAPITGSGPAGTFTVQLMSGTAPQAGNSYMGTIVTGQAAAEVASAGLTGSIFAVLRDTKRPR